MSRNGVLASQCKDYPCGSYSLRGQQQSIHELPAWRNPRSPSLLRGKKSCLQENDHRDAWCPGSRVRHRQSHRRRTSPTLTTRISANLIGAVLTRVHLHRCHRCRTSLPAAHKDSAWLHPVLGHTYHSNLFNLILNLFYWNLKEPDHFPVGHKFILLEPEETWPSSSVTWIIFTGTWRNLKAFFQRHLNFFTGTWRNLPFVQWNLNLFYWNLAEPDRL